MASFATVAELETFLGVAEDSLNAAQATELLTIASSTIRDECLQTIYAVEGDSVTLRGSWGREVWLPERPVVAVASITIDGTELAATAYKWTSDGRVTFYGDAWKALDGPDEGAEGGNRRYWGGDEVLVVVEYSHGYETVPANVRGVCLELAKRAIQNPSAGGIVQESVGSYSVSYSREAASVLTKGEQRRLRRYKRRAYTVAVG